MLRHMYPKADIPVVQLSLNQNLNFREHLEVGKGLRSLRENGVLIVGSGNITHNLRRVDFNPNAKPMDWAVEFDEKIKLALLNQDLDVLCAEDPKMQPLWTQALPTVEHYLPLLYVMGASSEDEQARFPFEGIELGSLSMRSVCYG